jgi:tetratricopeptide (TPR) repeat protein
MEEFKAILEQAEAVARQFVTSLLADETGRITVAVVLAALIGLLIGNLLGRPTKMPTRASATARPTPTQRPVEPLPPAAPPLPRSPTSVYRGMLEARGVPEEEISGRVRTFAEQVDGFRQAMSKLGGDRGDVASLVDDTRRHLENGEFEKTVTALEAIAERHGDAARKSRDAARAQFGHSAAAQEFLGDLQVALDDFAAAAACYRQAIETLPDKPANDLVTCLNKHGTAAYSAGDLVGATASFDRVRKILEKSLGVDHPDVATALNNLALMHYEQGDYAAAEPLYRRALGIDEKALGSQHADVATDLNNLALLYMNQGNFDAAEPMFSRSVAIKEHNFQLGHPSLVTGLRNYAILLRGMGRVEEAATLEARAEAKPSVRIRPPATTS